jgi:hypothetical protein
MPSSPHRITLALEADHPNLLNGLEAWLQLDLLTDQQVLPLSRLHLICALPEVSLSAPVVRETISSSYPQGVASSYPQGAATDFITPPTEQAFPRVQAPSNLLTRILQSLMAELSVVWLLVLGVFMVIVSSAVLAASQWQNFSPVGQYLVLLGYTLSFWGVSIWAGRQENLRLTASTLQIISLLLVPVNFWAIDRFLLQAFQIQNGVMATIAALMLSAITFPLFKSPLLPASAIEKTRALLCYLGLSYLQIGWEFSAFPILAIYLGSVGLTIARPRSSSKLLFLLGFALTLLLIRAVFIVGVDVAQLGLAFGICGWLMARSAQQLEPRSWSLRLWSFSAGLLGLGWLVSVGSVPWQALAVSGIGLWFCAERLQRFWRKLEIVGLVTISLQMSWLVWRLIPAPTQSQIFEFSTRLTGTQEFPAALLGLILFPYVIITLALSEWLYRQQKPALGKFAARISLVLGILLTGLSAIVPLIQTCNLLASTITLIWVTQQYRSRPAYSSLVYFAHLTGLFTIVSAIHYQFPNLSQSHWAGIFVAFTLVEWIFSEISQTVLQKSAWHIGFGFATLSYVLLLDTASSILETSWLVIPLALTGIAVRDSDRQEIAGWASTIALLAAQFLTLQSPTIGLMSLGWATLLMIVNTRFVLKLEAAQITIGFSLTFISWLLWYWVPGMRDAEIWLLVGAIATTLLWQLRRIFQSQTPPILTLYASASDGWAMLLCAGVLIGSTAHTIGLYTALTSPSLFVLAAIFLITAASARQTSSKLSFWAVGLGLELLVAESLAWVEPSISYLSIANVGLGLAAQVVGDRRQTESFWGWHGLPLMYGSLALFLRLQTFESWTGLISLGVALIAIGVGRRLPMLKPLTYLGAIGISLSAYELLFYQIQTLDWSDQLMSTATLGTVMMALYRWLFPLWSNYFRLSLAEVKQLAHFHWGISSVILSGAAVLTLVTPMSGTLALIGFATGMILSLYAIFQARHSTLTTAEFWLYAGLLEAAGLAWYLSTKPWFSGFFNGFLRPYAGAIAAIVAFILFVIPWDQLGWAKRPWQRVSLAVPLLVLGGTVAIVQPLSLVVTGVFYSLVASIRREIRWTYLSVGLLNWLILSQLHRLNVDFLFWQVLPIGLSILYFAYIEPSLQQSDKRESRHYVRVCGIGLICVVALFTQENYGILPGVVSLITIFAGLGLKTRAFLYIGTAVFLLNVFNQLVILATVYSFLKWVIGLCIGILLIWVAANFETRREQVTTLMQNWFSQLQEWQ